MAEKPDNKSVQKRRESDKVSLDSWKAIANYLNRSVRTVRRWEATEGLPVHRHRHTKGFSVYAFGSELDAWRAENQDSRSNVPVGIPSSPEPKLHLNMTHIVAVLIIAILIGGTAGRYFYQTEPTQQVDVVLPLMNLNAGVYWPESVAEVLVAPVFSAWADGRLHDALTESEVIVRRLPESPSDVQALVIDYLIVFSLNVGRVDDARKMLADLPQGGQRNVLSARIAFASGDMKRVTEVLRDGKNPATLSPAQSGVFLAMAAMESGNFGEAKARLQLVTSELFVEDQGYYFVALDMLAGALKTEGDLSGAIDVLERTMPQRHVAFRNRSGLFWLMCQRRLASFYREAGRIGLANELEDEIRNWMILADDDFPLAKSLAEV